MLRTGGLVMGRTALWSAWAILLLAEVVSAAPPDALPPGALHRLGTTQFQLDATVVATAFTADGKSVFAGTQSGLIVRYEFPGGKELSRIRLPDFNGQTMLFSADGATVLASGRTGSDVLRTVDTATGR